MAKFSIGVTDHLEGPADRASKEVYREVAEVVELADELGVRYAWFSEHHAHAHEGHLPTPLLFAVHMAGRTKQIHLGTAIICLNLHHPLDVAEQTAVADVLTSGRMAVGFGSGSTPEEFGLFGQNVTDEQERHGRFKSALKVIQSVWRGGENPPDSPWYQLPVHRALPRASQDLASRCWLAVNSAGSARIAGELGFNMMFSHLRTPAQYREYSLFYRASGGRGLIAANRPVIVGTTDEDAYARAEPALRKLWRRFQREGKIAAEMSEPRDIAGLCAHPINFIVGSGETVMRELNALHAESPFDVANLEVRWDGLDHAKVLDSLRLLMTADD